jgi:hypothetical protein
MPALYAWQVRWRIFRMYGELRSLESYIESRTPAESIGDLADRLDRLEEKAHRLPVPQFYADLLYTLRVHIALVRERLQSRGEAGRPGDTRPEASSAGRSAPP